MPRRARRSDNTSGRSCVYLEKSTDLWCAEVRRGKKRWRKRSTDREEVEAWLAEKERELVG